MRRLIAWWLFALLGALLFLGLATASWNAPLGPGRAALAQAERALGHPLRLLTRAAAAVVSVAQAQESTELRFREVPAESASRFDRKVVQRERGRDGESADTLVFPEPPEPPTPVVIGKSGGLTQLGADIVIERDEVVKGDISTVSGDITIHGHVEGSVTAFRGDIRLTPTARVDGDVVCIGGTLIEEPGSQVGGQRISAMGGQTITRDLKRKIRHLETEDHRRRSGDGTSTALAWLIVLLGLAFGFARLAPGRTGEAVAMADQHTARSLGIGALVYVLLVPSIVALALLVALLCITIIGIPLALAALFGYFFGLGVLAVWGYAVGAILIGGALSRSSTFKFLGSSAGDAGPSLTRRAVNGTVALMGVVVIGRMLEWIAGGTPLGGLGSFAAGLAIFTIVVVMTIGIGAWLRMEWESGRVGRWWSGRRNRGFANGGAAAASPAPPPVPPAPPTPPVPADPGAPGGSEPGPTA